MHSQHPPPDQRPERPPYNPQLSSGPYSRPPPPGGPGPVPGFGQNQVQRPRGPPFGPPPGSQGPLFGHQGQYPPPSGVPPNWHGDRPPPGRGDMAFSHRLPPQLPPFAGPPPHLPFPNGPPPGTRMQVPPPGGDFRMRPPPPFHTQRLPNAPHLPPPQLDFCNRPGNPGITPTGFDHPGDRQAGQGLQGPRDQCVPGASHQDHQFLQPDAVSSFRDRVSSQQASSSLDSPHEPHRGSQRPQDTSRQQGYGADEKGPRFRDLGEYQKTYRDSRSADCDRSRPGDDHNRRDREVFGKDASRDQSARDGRDSDSRAHSRRQRDRSRERTSRRERSRSPRQGRHGDKGRTREKSPSRENSSRRDQSTGGSSNKERSRSPRRHESSSRERGSQRSSSPHQRSKSRRADGHDLHDRKRSRSPSRDQRPRSPSRDQRPRSPSRDQRPREREGSLQRHSSRKPEGIDARETRVSEGIRDEPVAMDVTDLATNVEEVQQEAPDPIQEAAVLLVQEVLGPMMAGLPMVGPQSLEDLADLPPAEPAVPLSAFKGIQVESRRSRKRKNSKGAAALSPVGPSTASKAAREQRGKKFKWWLEKKARKTPMHSVPVASPRNPHSCGSGVGQEWDVPRPVSTSSGFPAVCQGRGGIGYWSGVSPNTGKSFSQQCSRILPKKNHQVCPMVGCTRTSHKIRLHILRHLPKCFRTQGIHSGPGFQEVLQLRLAVLRLIAQFMIGVGADEFELVGLVNSGWKAVRPNVTEVDLLEMRAMIDQQNWSRVVPSLQPVNTPAALVHFRPLVFLMNLLSDDQQRQLIDLGDIQPVTPAPQVPAVAPQPELWLDRGRPEAEPRNPVSQVLTLVPQPELRPDQGEPEAELRDSATSFYRGFDAHYHLDRMQASICKSRGYPNPLTPGRVPDHLVNVEGGVRNFCDPESFTTSSLDQMLGNFQEGSLWRYAVGIHPKKASVYTSEHWDLLMHYLAHPRVVALSEVGLDFSVAQNQWMHQEQLLHRLLDLGTLGKVLVMHLRGMDDDPMGNVVHKIALRKLREKCMVNQRIHLHCFSGDTRLVREWTNAFPHCYFGITGLVKTFNIEQYAAVCEIRGDRLLLETDSPHLKVHPELEYNTPYFLGDVGQLVADIRGVPLSEVMSSTFANGLRLYG